MSTEPTEASQAEAVGYADALSELDALLLDLEDDDIDVDLLATKVDRAAELIKLCRDRIDNAKVQVHRIVADLEADAPAEGDNNLALELDE